ncbi:hypothetical protein ACHMW5_35975 (plasmid) [Azospirillum melinis]|uniref:hypothetical protein n=1 Tax=Azospirillum melinis TaxID=328839 RepID=UPI0037584793
MDMSGDVSELRLALGKRIAEFVATKYPTKIAAAEAIGWTTDQINAWIAGRAKVPYEALYRLSAGSDDDLSWLCLGPRKVQTFQPARQRPFQETVLREVLTALAGVTAKDGITFRPDSFADLVFDLHDYVCEQRNREGADANANELGSITHFIRLAAQGRQSP